MTVKPALKVFRKLADIFSGLKLQSVVEEKVAPDKSENPVVRRDTLGSESIGRKYRVMSDDDSDFPVGSVVTCVEYFRHLDGSVFFPNIYGESAYMKRRVLLQEITEGDSN